MVEPKAAALGWVWKGLEQAVRPGIPAFPLKLMLLESSCPRMPHGWVPWSDLDLL